MIEYRAHDRRPPERTRRPFTIRLMITSRPGYEVLEYSCHEGNGAVPPRASRARRAYERQVAAAKAKGLPIPRAPRSTTSQNPQRRAGRRAARVRYQPGASSTADVMSARTLLPLVLLLSVLCADAGPRRMGRVRLPRAGRHRRTTRFGSTRCASRTARSGTGISRTRSEVAPMRTFERAISITRSRT